MANADGDSRMVRQSAIIVTLAVMILLAVMSIWLAPLLLAPQVIENQTAFLPVTVNQ